MLIEAYNSIKKAVKAIHNFIFPMRDKIYGYPTMDHVVSGHLTFGSKEEDADKPIMNMHLELWARTFWGGYRKLSEGVSDREGNFRLPYDLYYVHRIWIWKV